MPSASPTGITFRGAWWRGCNLRRAAGHDASSTALCGVWHDALIAGWGALEHAWDVAAALRTSSLPWQYLPMRMHVAMAAAAFAFLSAHY